MRALAILFSFAFTLQGFATHILGGEMSYTYLGNDDYFVTLTLYRDCGPDNVNNTALDFQAAIGIFNSSGSLVNTVHFDLPGELNVPVVLINPALGRAAQHLRQNGHLFRHHPPAFRHWRIYTYLPALLPLTRGHQHHQYARTGNDRNGASAGPGHHRGQQLARFPIRPAHGASFGPDLRVGPTGGGPRR